MQVYAQVSVGLEHGIAKLRGTSFFCLEDFCQYTRWPSSLVAPGPVVGKEPTDRPRPDHRLAYTNAALLCAEAKVHVRSVAHSVKMLLRAC